jgi:hypothetical protein
MFEDTGQDEDYLIEYTTGRSSQYGFAPGEGYWLVSRTDIVIDRDVNNIGLAEDYSYAIPLNDGWNIISNPFINSVPWQAVKDFNGMNPGEVIHRYNGSYSVASFLNPYVGYYYYNSDNRSALNIPYQISNSGTLLKSGTESVLQVILEEDGEERSSIGIGFNEESTIDFDGFDILKPRSDFEDASISIYNHGLELPYKFLYTEYRAEIGEGQIYDVRIKLVPGTEANLLVEGLDLLEDYEVTLHDLRLNKFYDLKRNASITYSSLHKDNKFNLLIGDVEFISGIKEKFIPAQFELYQNYPNPFNPRTIIRFALADEGNVNLSVYNSIGELMKVIVEAKYYDKGFHEVVFDGSELASGIYFYKIQSGSFSAVKKLVLIK